MGINIKNKGVKSIYYSSLPVIAVYTRGQLIWPIKTEPIIDIILSCYYNGYWIDEYPWTDDTPWTD
jgi:hypothetical protein